MRSSALARTVYEVNVGLMDPQISGRCAAATVVVSNADVSALDLMIKECL